MKVSTWNVNSIKARLDHATRWVSEQQPDVLMLQELKGLEFPLDAFKSLNYQVEFLGQKAYNGVAILSKHPINLIRTGLPGDDADEQARFIDAETKGIRFLNIYAPNGNPVDSEKFPYKLGWLKRLCAYAAELRDHNVPFVIGGDFNIIPEDIDCYDPAAWAGDALFRPESRQIFRVLSNMGLTDALRVFNKGRGVYTFWDYFQGSWQNNKGIRIDHFLVSPGIADRLTGCVVDANPRSWDKASDHTPVVMTLRD